MSRHSTTHRRLVTLLITAILIATGVTAWGIWPRHYPVSVTASTSPEQVIDQYLAASNRHACADANSLVAPNARLFTSCPSVWEYRVIRSHNVIRILPGIPGDTNVFGQWKQAVLVQIDMDVQRNPIISGLPSGQSSEGFGLGRNSDDEPWKIVQIGGFI